MVFWFYFKLWNWSAAPDAVDATHRAKSSTSGSSGLINSTKHHISVVTSHLVGRKPAKRESLTISHPIPLAAAKKLGETVYHKIQMLDDNQQPIDK